MILPVAVQDPEEAAVAVVDTNLISSIWANWNKEPKK